MPREICLIIIMMTSTWF